MEKNSPLVVNASVQLKLVLGDPYKVEFIDNLKISSAIKAKVLIPYLEALFENLTLRSEKTQNAVPRFALNEVFFHFDNTICSIYPYLDL